MLFEVFNSFGLDHFLLSVVMALGGRGYQVVGVTYLFLVLSTISVLLRCYVRLFLVKRFGVDDYFALLAWVSLYLHYTVNT